MTPDADRESGRVIRGQIIPNLRVKVFWVFFLIKDFLECPGDRCVTADPRNTDGISGVLRHP